MAEKFRYRVDSRKTIFTHTIEEARENMPSPTNPPSYWSG